MRIPKRLGEARKVLKDNVPSTEEMIQQKLDEFRNLDIKGIIKGQDEFSEITKDLSDEERARFDSEFEDMVDVNEGLINSVADALGDPETREKIIDLLKIKVRGS
jgi:hypothetical protein